MSQIFQLDNWLLGIPGRGKWFVVPQRELLGIFRDDLVGMITIKMSDEEVNHLTDKFDVCEGKS